MSDIDLQVTLMEAGRMNLMHLPPGAISWLWDRPTKQVDAAESLAVAANAHGNPVVDASLLKADQNVLLIKCQGGECFRIYPDGGFSFEDTPMDIGGCSSVLQGMQQGDCPMDDNGHQMAPEDGPQPVEGGGQVVTHDMLQASLGNAEHMDTVQPESGVASPQGMTNLEGEPTMDEDQGGDWGGPGASSTGGMGTGTPYVGDIAMDASPELENQMMSRELGENTDFAIRDTDDETVDELMKVMGLVEMDDWSAADYRRDRMDAMRSDQDRAPTPPEQTHAEVYDDATDSMKEAIINISRDVQPTEYEGPHVFAQGGATVDNMELAEPVQVNGKVYTKLDNELAALIMATHYQDEVEPSPQAWESLRQHIEDREGADVDVPVKRYPMTR
jgi:hypothetical protein